MAQGPEDYMNTKKSFLIIALFLMLSPLAAQPIKLQKAEFQSAVVDQWWSYENKETKRDCDMRIFVVNNSVFELNCINWTDGFSGNKCAYDLTLTGNIFELKAKDCQNNLSPGFLYGYLNEAGQLSLIVRKTRQAMGAALLSEKDWIRFEKIKR